MKQTNLKIQLNSPVYSIGGNDSRKLIYVLHGYGQLAKYFLKKFEPLISLGYTIVAPEGLHRFYLQGTEGRVGASWMTKENRELDIRNHINYLNTLHTSLLNLKEWDTIHVLGFSQGVATAFRWIANGQIKPSKLLICSGMIPRDVNLDEQNSVFREITLSYFTGTKDPYKTEEAVVAFQEKITKTKLQIEVFEFEGMHEVDIESICNYLK
ncbi:MAG: hypothetical protein KJP21_01175 [Bacteroidia bacterium]|nr:hypothetical protein [Bacteroidia bacterium]NNJ55848.1 hypothetical protein [Bacteroidia bacterium]